MKKLVLVMAVMLASVGVFAQANMKAQKLDRDALLKKQVTTDKMAVKRSIPMKSSYDGTFDLCDFSDPTAYTFGVTDNHTTINSWTLLDGTINVYPDWWPLVYWRSDAGNTDAAFATWVDGFEPSGEIPMSVLNGFAGFDLYDVEGTDAVDAYIKFNTPIHTTGTGIDIYFVQLVPTLWNSDQYFIEWSTDPNFAEGNYESVAINIKGVDGIAGNYYGTSGNYDDFTNALIGRKYVNLPTGTSICDVTTPDLDIYIRFRVTAPAAGENIPGYYWFVDDVSYGYTPANRIDVLDYTIDDGYRVIPEILIPEPFRTTAVVSNTGSSVAEGLHLVNSFYAVSAGATDADPDVFTFIEAGTSDTIDLENAIFTIYPYTNSAGETDSTRPEYIRYKEMSVSEYAIPQSNEGVGAYAYTSDLMYSIGGEEYTRNLDTSYYYVYPEDASLATCYTWQKDLGILIERVSGVWDYYYPGEGYYGSGTGALTDGYRVCAAYTAQGLADDSTPAYITGVEVVPAVDSCEAGAVIRGSLWVSNLENATAWNDAVLEALDNEENPVISEDHVVAASELNNSSDASNNYERFSGVNLNTIFLPFTYTATPLEGNQTYYACYTKVGNSGKFYLGKDYDYWTSYGYNSGWSILVWSNNMASSQRQYDWGYVWYTNAYSNGSVPMIRLVVSTSPNPISSINEVANAASYMNAYPNPATDNVTLSYSLNQKGNVTITVTDLMGRTALVQNEGNREAGISYKSRIDVSSLNNGTYFYTVEVNGVKSTNKLVVNR